jgi:hypothetical protein
MVEAVKIGAVLIKDPNNWPSGLNECLDQLDESQQQEWRIKQKLVLDDDFRAWADPIVEDEIELRILLTDFAYQAIEARKTQTFITENPDFQPPQLGNKTPNRIWISPIKGRADHQKKAILAALEIAEVSLEFFCLQRQTINMKRGISVLNRNAVPEPVDRWTLYVPKWRGDK